MIDKIKGEFVRDICSVIPKSKSEVRRRLNEIISQHNELLIKKIEEYKNYYNSIEDERNLGKKIACDDIITLIKNSK